MTKRKGRMAFRDAMDLVGDDMPDGAFFAMAHEIAGLEYGEGFDELADGAEEPTVMRRRIWCVGCNMLVEAMLTDGREIYPHRKDLTSLPFWKCPTCANYVGCHHKTKDHTRPLGNIPTTELRAVRLQIHKVIDPLWKYHGASRSFIYRKLSEVLGRKYHTAETRTVEEARRVLGAAKALGETLVKNNVTEIPSIKCDICDSRPAKEYDRAPTADGKVTLCEVCAMNCGYLPTSGLRFR